MKKLLVLMLALSTTLAFASCTNPSTSDETPVGGEDNAIEGEVAGNENNENAETNEGENAVEGEGAAEGENAVEGEGNTIVETPGEGGVSTEDENLDNEISFGDVVSGTEEDTSKTVSVLAAGWNTYADDQKFPAMGGDMEAMVDGAPGNYSIADAEALDAVLGFPAASIASIDEAASLMHMMNANTFTGAAYHLVEGTDAAALAEEIKTNILARQWMCGFPETLVIIKADDCLITAFGNGELIENFKTKTLEANAGAELVSESPIE